jgi:hypothetical protein
MDIDDILKAYHRAKAAHDGSTFDEEKWEQERRGRLFKGRRVKFRHQLDQPTVYRVKSIDGDGMVQLEDTIGQFARDLLVAVD